MSTEMKVKFVDLRAQYEEIKSEVADAMGWFSNAPTSSSAARSVFEDEFAHYCGTEFAWVWIAAIRVGARPACARRGGGRRGARSHQHLHRHARRPSPSRAPRR
jgi:hypothetical protein